MSQLSMHNHHQDIIFGPPNQELLPTPMQIDRHPNKQIKDYEPTYSCIHGGRKFQAKEMERELFSKSWVVLVPASTIKYLIYGILRYCFLFEVQPLEKVVPLHYHWRKLMIVKDYRWHFHEDHNHEISQCKISPMTKIANNLNCRNCFTGCHSKESFLNSRSVRQSNTLH